MPTYRAWLVRYGRQEWELLEADDYYHACELARKKWKSKLVSVKPDPVPSKDAA